VLVDPCFDEGFLTFCCFTFFRCLRSSANRRIRGSRSRLFSQILRERKFSEHRWLQSLHGWLQFKRSFLRWKATLLLLFSLRLCPLFRRRNFANGVFTPKTHYRTFTVLTLRRRNLKPQQSPVTLDLILRNTQARKSHDYRKFMVFKSFVFKIFPSTLKPKPGVFKFLGFEERFPLKSPFS